MLVTDDVAGQLSELDLTGSTFEANVDFFSLQRFQNVRTLRLAQCRKLTDGGPVGERHTGGTGQEPRLEVLDLSECVSIKGMRRICAWDVWGRLLFVLRLYQGNRLLLNVTLRCRELQRVDEWLHERAELEGQP